MEVLKSYFNKKLIEAGCDEAGRGCLAGPVVAAAVILPPNFSHPLLNDSKQVSEKNRAILREVIEKEALAWEVSFVDNHKIDEINILQASILAMQQASLRLKIRPELLLIDGNRFNTFEIPHQCFVKGDSRFLAIAAASILSKTHRDEYMKKIHVEYPNYSWDVNAGYPTKKHKEVIEKYGLCSYHRKTFKLKNITIK